MKIRVVQRMAAALACVGMMFPHSVMAEAPVELKVADVALRDGGLFVGKVVNAQGKPISEVEVLLIQEGKEIANTTTDKEGVFAAQGLRGGQYQVVAEGGAVAYRLWAPDTAPPAANTSALIVTGDEIVNGQFADGCLCWIREHPMLVAAGIATAIAVPLALADDDDDNS